MVPWKSISEESDPPTEREAQGEVCTTEESGFGSLLFSDATSPLKDAKYVVLGVSYEQTTSHRKGTALAPASVREESYNFESYNHRYDIDLENVDIYDMGTIAPTNPNELEGMLDGRMDDIFRENAIPLIIGGEHSITPFCVNKVLKNICQRGHPGLKVVVIDAHLDFRNTYLGEKNSHACVTRRSGEMVGFDSIMALGVRSMEKNETRDAMELGMKWVGGFDFDLKQCIEELEGFIDGHPVYLTLDMDGIDPAFAPGVGTPEPFGISPRDVVAIMECVGRNVVGADVVEICPPNDNGITSSLGAKLLRELMALQEKKGKIY